MLFSDVNACSANNVNVTETLPNPDDCTKYMSCGGGVSNPKRDCGAEDQVYNPNSTDPAIHPCADSSTVPCAFTITPPTTPRKYLEQFKKRSMLLLSRGVTLYGNIAFKQSGHARKVADVAKVRVSSCLVESLFGMEKQTSKN